MQSCSQTNYIIAYTTPKQMLNLMAWILSVCGSVWLSFLSLCVLSQELFLMVSNWPPKHGSCHIDRCIQLCQASIRLALHTVQVYTSSDRLLQNFSLIASKSLLRCFFFHFNFCCLRIMLKLKVART